MVLITASKGLLKAATNVCGSLPEDFDIFEAQ
jgi:hypothetical protein